MDTTRPQENELVMIARSGPVGEGVLTQLPTAPPTSTDLALPAGVAAGAVAAGPVAESRISDGALSDLSAAGGLRPSASTGNITHAAGDGGGGSGVASTDNSGRGGLDYLISHGVITRSR